MIQTAKASVKAYLEQEDQSTQRHEYRNGDIIEMTGGTTNHNRLVVALCTYLNLALTEQDGEVFTGDVKVWIPDFQFFTYPDLMLVQGEPHYYAELPGQPQYDIIENPGLIVEVLSKSTRQYDQSDKFDAYRTLESLQEYVLIDQYSFWVKQFVKNAEHQWTFSEAVGSDATLKLHVMDFQLSFAELYKRVNFEDQS
jgi:Uma2 family endonuclease